MFCLRIFATAAVFAVAAAVPALALDNNPMGTVTKSGLEGQGYTCALVSTGFWECTKDGGTTYWCDVSSCQPKPLVRPPGGHKFGSSVLKSGGAVLKMQ